MSSHFRPLGADTAKVTAVSGLSAEQLTAITAPFEAKPKSIATLGEFTVTVDLGGVLLPESYLLRVWAYVIASARATYAPLSHYPLPPPLPPPKNNLFRLLGGEAENSDSVTVVLPAPLRVARIAVEIRGIFTPDLSVPDIPPTPIPPPQPTDDDEVIYY